MRKLIVASFLSVPLALGALAQEQAKSWDQWSAGDAQKILNDSPWGHTQTETDTSEMFFIPGAGGGIDSGRSSRSNRSRQGATNQAVNVNFRIRFFTARPIRQAFMRLMMLNQKMDEQTKERLRSFANLRSDNLIIVTVAFDSSDPRYANPVMQAFNVATTDSLKNDTYLERKDGKRVFLSEYVPPGKDGFGARFIFPRIVDERPFLNEQSGEVRFYSKYYATSNPLQLDRRFKVADMIYDGKLEF